MIAFIIIFNVCVLELTFPVDDVQLHFGIQFVETSSYFQKESNNPRALSTIGGWGPLTKEGPKGFKFLCPKPSVLPCQLPAREPVLY